MGMGTTKARPDLDDPRKAQPFHNRGGGISFTAPAFDPNAYNNPNQGFQQPIMDRAFGTQGRDTPIIGTGRVDAQQVQAPRIFAPRADQGAVQGQQARAQQQEAIGLMGQAAQGQAPSVAQEQLRMGMDQNIRQSMALANSAGGGPGAQMLAQRQAAQAQAQAGQNLAAQSGLLRAQEMAQARGQFADATTAARAGDLGFQQQGFQQGLAPAQMGLQADLANQGATLQADTVSNDLMLRAGIANQGAALTGRQLDDARERGLLQTGLGVGTQTMQGNIARTQDDVAIQQDLNRIEAGLAGGDADRRTQVVGGLFGAAGAGIGAAAASDERAKKNIQSADKQIRGLLSNLEPSTFEYKDPALGDKRAGVMAQDLEKSEVGRTMVSDGPDGIKRVDIPSATSALLGTVAHLNRRLDKLEKGKRNAGSR